MNLKPYELLSEIAEFNSDKPLHWNKPANLTIEIAPSVFVFITIRENHYEDGELLFFEIANSLHGSVDSGLFFSLTAEHVANSASVGEDMIREMTEWALKNKYYLMNGYSSPMVYVSPSSWYPWWRLPTKETRSSLNYSVELISIVVQLTLCMLILFTR